MPINKNLIPISVFSVFSNLLMLVAPLHMMQVYDRVLSSGSQQTLLYITLIAIVALILFGMCEAIRSRLAQRMSTQYVVDRADALFSSATASNVSTNVSQDMLRNHNTVKMFIASKAYISLFDLPFSPVFLLLLFLLHFQIGLITLIGAGVLIMIALINKKAVAADQQQTTASNANAVNFASAVIARGEDIKAMGLLPQLMERWGVMTGASLNAQDRSTAKSAFFMGVSRSTRQILQVLIMAWGAFLVLQGDMSG
ncbi:MAG: ABC transporter transmembrane domain-containing protein, partial [Salaquimonas sp.]